MRKAISATTTYSNEKVQQFGSTVADEKGRKIGLIVMTRTREVVEGSSNSWSIEYPENFGTMYGVRVQKSKDGKSWGASQPYKWFRTEEEAKQVWINKLADRIADDWK